MMTRIFKSRTFSPSDSPVSTLRAQWVWSLCVAVVMAIVALQQAVGSRRLPQRSLANEMRSPQTLITGKPAPLSQDALRHPELQ